MPPGRTGVRAQPLPRGDPTPVARTHPAHTCAEHTGPGISYPCHTVLHPDDSRQHVFTCVRAPPRCGPCRGVGPWGHRQDPSTRNNVRADIPRNAIPCGAGGMRWSGVHSERTGARTCAWAPEPRSARDRIPRNVRGNCNKAVPGKPWDFSRHEKRVPSAEPAERLLKGRRWVGRSGRRGSTKSHLFLITLPVPYSRYFGIN